MIGGVFAVQRVPELYGGFGVLGWWEAGRETGLGVLLEGQ